MIESRSCPKCGSPLPADAPGGVCPKCLIKRGFESTVGLDAAGGDLPEPGEQFGPYRIGRLLGQGGMGAVYDAEHTESGRHVALKVLNHRLESPEHRQRFLREGRLAASINHPNNVYIYGTDEIETAPVIAMELARGGTLQERVKRDGPLPIGEAVDVILQIIAGLEAAEAAGVLHRDVKPSNCFIDADGTVKIGDFGLSVSTASRAETNLTQTGVFLGTPAFSSPEQLRGDELNVRSDIYSVGVTLFYLLTGRTPFDAKQMVQLLATVLERPAPLPASFRPEIPPGLAKVVVRCLAKQSSHRFKSYDELRQALFPYNSTAPTPATLGFRILACGIDYLLIAAIAALLPLLWIRDDASTWGLHFDTLASPGPSLNETLMLIGLGGVLLHLAYFTLAEWIWGATPGKGICRLRVVRAGRDTAGLLPALVRASIFFAPNFLPLWIYYAYDPVAGAAAYEASDARLLGVCLAGCVMLFSPIRRRNGYAGIHELVSGTRVVRTPGGYERRPGLTLPDEPLPENVAVSLRETNASEPPGDQTIGPYHILGTLESGQPHDLILAYDTRLLRKVWIRTCAAGAPPIAQHLRELARIGRLRWLSGERTAAGGWDAYEAPPGKPLLSLIDTRQSWDAVRFWLTDLAQELDTARRDNTMPTAVDLDRVWITADGRAKLLDFSPPGLNGARHGGTPLPSFAKDPTAAAIFLKRVAIAALEGTVVSADDARSRDISVPIPLSARTVLNDLGRPASPAIPTAELESFTQRAAAVSEGRRAGALFACWLIPLVMAGYVTFMFSADKQFLEDHPKVGELSGYVKLYQSLDEDEVERREAVAVLVADRFRSTITDSEVMSHAGARSFLDARGRRLVEGFVESHPAVTPQQIADAEARLAGDFLEIRILGSSPHDSFYSTPVSVTITGLLMVVLVVLVILPSLLSALILGDSLLLRWLDVAIVTGSGAPASRLRVLWRSIVLWGIVMVALGLLFYVAMAEWKRTRWLRILVAYALVRMFVAERGLHDHLAGTWLVPR